MIIKDCDKFEINDKILYEKIGNEGMVFYSEETRETLILNSTGLLVFEMCFNLNYSEIRQRYIDLYSKEVSNIEELVKDLDEILFNMLNKNLIKIM